jgi:hypothetical protein
MWLLHFPAAPLPSAAGSSATDCSGVHFMLGLDLDVPRSSLKERAGVK